MAGSRILTPRYFLFCAISVLIMMWPALFNGGAILFFDTAAYFNGAAHALKTVLGINTHWIHDAPATAPMAGLPHAALAAGAQAKQVTGGRSVYYGLLVLIPDAIGSLWLSVLVQSAIMVWAMALLLHTLGATRDWLTLALCVFLGLLTSISFFDSYLMPDFLAGVAIIATAILAAYGNEMRPAVRWQWFVLLALALCAHNSHILITIVTVVAALVLTGIVTGRPRWRALAPVLGALVLAGLLQVGFSVAVSKLYGRDAANPPFISARLASQQPSVRYLRATCPGNGLKICTFLNQLPEDSDAFLWAREPGKAVFTTASPEVNAALSAEQVRFGLAVLRYDFAGQLAASLHDFAEQFGRFSLSEFAYSADLDDYLKTKVPAGEMPVVQHERLFTGRFALSTISTVLTVNVALSALFVLFFAVTGAPGRRRAPDMAMNLWLFVILVVTGVVANAGVTGVLSAPHDRYQARVIWLIPAAMFLIVAFKKRLLLVKLDPAHGLPADGKLPQ